LDIDVFTESWLKVRKQKLPVWHCQPTIQLRDVLNDRQCQPIYGDARVLFYSTSLLLRWD
jgi:hypothetical protein